LTQICRLFHQRLPPFRVSPSFLFAQQIHPGSSIGHNIMLFLLVAAMLVNLLTLPATVDAKGEPHA
jgi:hypothetical protein